MCIWWVRIRTVYVDVDSYFSPASFMSTSELVIAYYYKSNAQCSLLANRRSPAQAQAQAEGKGARMGIGMEVKEANRSRHRGRTWARSRTTTWAARRIAWRPASASARAGPARARARARTLWDLTSGTRPTRALHRATQRYSTLLQLYMYYNEGCEPKYKYCTL